MFTEAELIDAIDQIKSGKHSIQNCERLAAIYVVLDHLYGNKPIPEDIGYSEENRVESEVGYYGESKFLKLISGKPARDVWFLMDELVEALMVFNPRLMNSFFEKLHNL